MAIKALHSEEARSCVIRVARKHAPGLGRAAMLSDIPTVGGRGSVARVAATAALPGRLVERAVSLRALLVALLVALVGMEGRAAVPELLNPTATGVTATRAVVGGNVSGDGGRPVTERGVVYADASGGISPVIGGPGVTKVTTAGTNGVFTLPLTNLVPGTTYVFRAYALNGDGAGYTIPGTFTAVMPGTSAGAVEPSFNPNANGNVNGVSVLADGRILMWGAFTQVSGVTRMRIAILNADGTLDTAFNPNVDGEIMCAAVQPDGRIVIGGSFASVDGRGRLRLARLNANGSVDTDFNPNVNGVVQCLALQSDGRVLMGGGFTTVGSVARSRIARIFANGFADPNFTPGADGTVHCLAVQADGRVLIGGAFMTVSGTARARIARLQSNGGLDTGFNPGTDGTVHCLALQPDGRVLIGGAFTALNGSSRNRIARLLANGAVDLGFVARTSGTVLAIALQPDGAVLCGGSFVAANGAARNRVARFSAGGVLDSSFNPDVGGDVTCLALQADGEILTGGAFTTVGGLARNRIARLNADGSPDAGFDIPASDPVRTVAVQMDGRLLIGGNFTTVGGVSRSGFARLSASGLLEPPLGWSGATGFVVQPDGALVIGGWGGGFLGSVARFDPNDRLDTGFDPRVSGEVFCLLGMPDGKILLGGNVASVGPTARAYLARLRADGALDTGFLPVLNAEVHSLASQADGKVLVAGMFSMANGVSRNRLARFQPDGSLDEGFNPDVNGIVASIVVQPDGRVVIGGWFNRVGGVPRNYIARLHPDGSLDTGFNPDASNAVQSIVMQADGRLVIGGSFVSVGGVARDFVARINGDGTLDLAFNPDADAAVHSLALLTDGRLLMGGAFTTVGGLRRERLARILNNPASQQLAMPEATRILWSRGGSAPELSNVVFESSVDNGATWNPLAAGVPGASPGTWEASVPAQPPGVKLRASGHATDGGRSTWPVRQVIGVTPAVLAAPPVVTATSALAGSPRVLLDGAISSDGGEVLERGFVYAPAAINSDPRIGGAGVVRQAIGGTSGILLSSANGLEAAQIYAFRTYVVNSAGVAYSPVAMFTTPAVGTVAGDPARDTIGGANGAVLAIAVQPGGGMLIGGTFTSYGNRIARLDRRGFHQSDYDPNADGTVSAMALQNNGRVIVAGSFTKIGGVPCPGIARLHADGTLDRSFSGALTSGSIQGITIDMEGRVLIWGLIGHPGATATFRLVRLHEDGTVDSGFNPEVSSVSAVAVQADGKLLIGGGGGAALRFMARLNPDGSLDSDFAPAINGAVRCLSVLPDRKVMIGGTFTQVDGVMRRFIARLHPDGSLDPAFNANLGGGTEVSCFAVQSDGRIIIGGTFSLVGAEARSNLARLDADGRVDLRFSAGTDAGILCVALQSDGIVLIGGSFTRAGGVSCSGFARLANDPATRSLTTPDAGRVVWNRGGSAPAVSDVMIDSSEDNGATWSALGFGTLTGGALPWELSGLSIPPNAKFRARGRIVNGGRSLSVIADVFPITLADLEAPIAGVASGFQGKPAQLLRGTMSADGGEMIERGFVFAEAAVNPDPQIGGTGVVRLHATGTGRDFHATATMLLPATTYAFRSYVTNSAGTAYSPVGTFTTAAQTGVAGELAASTFPEFTSDVHSLVDQGDGRLLAGGGANSLLRWFGDTWSLIRITNDGAIDRGLIPNSSGAVRSIVMRKDGGLLFGGNGWASSYVARLRPDASIDTVFPSAFNYAVASIAPLADGKMLIGGHFTTVGGVERRGIARLHADGLLDPGFDLKADGTVTSIAVQGDGRVLIGGSFSTVGGLPRPGLARLHADGSVDAGFAPAGARTVLCVAAQPDGRVIAGGPMINMHGSRQEPLVRLNADGTLDTAFDPVLDGGVSSLALQADGKIILGGEFRLVDGFRRNRVARLHADGLLDLAFDPDANNVVHSVFVQADGRVLLGGSFTTVGGMPRLRAARLANDPASQTLTVTDASRVVWTRAGAAPEVTDVSFDSSVDGGVTWTQLGAGVRAGSTANWELGGLTLPPGARLRVTGRAAGGHGNGSSGLVRQVHSLMAIGSLASSAVTATAASCSAVVTGDEAVLERGFVHAPVVVNSLPEIGADGVVRVPAAGGAGAFTTVLTGLRPATTCAIRAYATGARGTIYTGVATFTTLTIIEDWRRTHFGTISDAGDAADGADPDKDGLPNLMEFALNLPPGVPDGFPAGVRAVGSLLEFSYARGSIAAGAGIAFHVEWSDDLANWSSDGVLETIVGDNGTHQRVRASLPAGPMGLRFMRLRVRQGP